jgi:RNA polymerase sigma factor (sigma-70 family)
MRDVFDPFSFRRPDRISRPRDGPGFDPIGRGDRIPVVGKPSELVRARDVAAARGAQNGDDAALEDLYQRYGGACYGLARRILRDETLAQDVVQEVFLTCWRGGGYDPTRGGVASWLLSVTHHKAVDAVRKEERLRSRRASGEALEDLAQASGSAEDQAWSLLQSAAVRGALRELPTEQREVLLLAYYGGYSQREISAMTGVPLGTVKSRTLGAMRRLRTELRPQVTEQGGGGP